MTIQQQRLPWLRMRSLIPGRGTLTPALGIVFLMLLGAPQAKAAFSIPDPLCNTTISGSAYNNATIYLTHNVPPCTGNWLTIDSATGVTVDLNSHFVTGLGLSTGITALNHSDGLTVHGGTIRNFGTGIDLSQSFAATIVGVTLRANQVGVFIVKAGDTRVEHNTIEGPGEAGISVEESEDIRIKANVIRGFRSPPLPPIYGGGGIVINGSNSVHAFISDNTVTGNTNGLFVNTLETNLTVICNRFLLNMNDGIAMEGAGDAPGGAQISGNTASRNGRDGIFIFGPNTGTRTEDNVTNSNGRNGIHVQMVTGAQNFIVNNEAFRNGSGVDLFWNLSGPLLNCWKLNNSGPTSPASLPVCAVVNIH